MTDATAFRDGVGRLLAEVQRIKSEGDYAAARALFETYGVHFDPALRDEIVARVDRAAAAVVHRRSSCRGSRPAATPAVSHRRRRDLVSLRPRDADARVLGASRAATTRCSHDADVPPHACPINSAQRAERGRRLQRGRRARSSI